VGGAIKKTKAEFVEAGHPDLDEGEIWLYSLSEHKTERHIGARDTPLNIGVQDILKKYLGDDPERPVFLNRRGNTFKTRILSNAVKKVNVAQSYDCGSVLILSFRLRLRLRFDLSFRCVRGTLTPHFGTILPLNRLG